MTVKVREYKKSKRVGFEVDIRFDWRDGTPFRKRFRAPVNTEAQAMAWGRRRELDIIQGGEAGELAKSKRTAPAEAPATKEVPTLKEFWPSFIDGHCVANRQKPSGIERKQSVFRAWLEPRLGSLRLDEIGAEHIVKLKADLAKKSAKTANNVLTALSACLKFAGPEGLKRSDGLGIIKQVPRVRLLAIDADDVPKWYEVPEYKQLVDGAAKLDPRIHLLVLLGGSAGLRRGEIIALKWADLDIKRGIIHVQRSIWWGKNGVRNETLPKGGKGRNVTMTATLIEALKKHRNLRERVLTMDDGRDLTNKIVRRWFERAQRSAGLEATGAIHRLRHTFCSMLASEGAPPGAIQRLAGHASITTTMKYMHLSPTTLDAAIGLLDAAWTRPAVGETVEKGAVA
ncbi:MAG: site-specific integrase [Polyangiaceae bacterium]